MHRRVRGNLPWYRHLEPLENNCHVLRQQTEDCGSWVACRCETTWASVGPDGCRTFSTHDCRDFGSSSGNTALLDPRKRYAIPSVFFLNPDVPIRFDVQGVESSHLDVRILRYDTARYRQTGRRRLLRIWVCIVCHRGRLSCRSRGSPLYASNGQCEI